MVASPARLDHSRGNVAKPSRVLRDQPCHGPQSGPIFSLCHGLARRPQTGPPPSCTSLLLRLPHSESFFPVWIMATQWPRNLARRIMCRNSFI